MSNTCQNCRKSVIIGCSKGIRKKFRYKRRIVFRERRFLCVQTYNRRLSELQAVKNKSKDIDMTSGNIGKVIVRFALPLLLGNLFQQLYNMVDTWVIGQINDNAAYAAVGSVGPIVNIFIGLFSGLASGASVVISQYYGAKDSEKVSVASHTAAVVTLVLGVVFTVVGLATTPLMLDIMLHDKTGEIYVAANTYLVIYFSGIIAMLIYNMGAGILRAVGDSRRPFYFLAVAAVINTALDLLFVYAFGMGVAGVAYATVIAQVCSAALIVIELFKTKREEVRLSLRKMRCNGAILWKIVKLGTPAALQMALTAFSNVFVQSYISGVNSDQDSSLGGWTTYNKVDQLIFLPIQSIALAATTFVGQNVGGGDIARAKKGTFISLFLAFVSALALMIPIIFAAEPIARCFNPDRGVVEHATLLLRYITPFYVLCCVNQVFTAAMRGAGNTTAPMIIMLSSFIGVRQLYLYVTSTFISNEFLPIAFGYPVGWLCCAILMAGYYFLFFRMGAYRVAEKSK